MFIRFILKGKKLKILDKIHKENIKMYYKLFGKSGLRVSELALGTMTFGEDWGWGANREECKKMFDSYTNAGGNFIDTANNYTNGSAEKIVGELLIQSGERDKFVVATKYTLNKRKNDPNAGGNHRKNMMQAVNASLQRLQTDYIDLLWLHAWDFLTPIDEIMRGLDDLVRMGKVHYLGISDTPAWVVARANTMAELRGWTPFIGLQLQYSLIERTIEREFVPMANQLDLAIAAWAVLGGGALTGKYTKENLSGSEPKRLKEGSVRLSAKNLAIAQEVVSIASELGCKPSQVALNWVRNQKGVFIPIIGARKFSQFQENLDCLNIEVKQEYLDKLSRISNIDLGFPHDFLNSESVKESIFGGAQEKIINHRI